MTNEAEHAANRRVGIARDQVELREFVFALAVVIGLPIVMPACNALIEVDNRAAVDPKFLKRLLKYEIIRGHPRKQMFVALRLGAKHVP